MSLVSIAVVMTSKENGEPPPLVIRVDDIQDFAFRDAQLFLLDESTANEVPLSLAVIAGMFGEDREVVQAVKLAVSRGSDLAVHGWEHEDLSKLSFEEQAALLSRSKSRIQETLYFNTAVLVPPMFSFNEDTVAAMRQTGCNIISTYTDISQPGSFSGVLSLPATVELSDYANGVWTMKSLDAVKSEIAKSVQRYGFAMIVTHPQEFMADGKLNQASTESYRALLSALKEDYIFTTLSNLSQTLSP